MISRRPLIGVGEREGYLMADEDELVLVEDDDVSALRDGE